MLRINPAVPITWRSAACVQLGVDEPVLIDGLLPTDIALIDDLTLGLGSAQYYSRAQDLGVDMARAGSLLSLLDEAGAMVPPHSESAATEGTGHRFATGRLFSLAPEQIDIRHTSTPILVIGPFRTAIERQLSACGFRMSSAPGIDMIDPAHPPLVVTTAHLVPDLNAATWLTDREIAHCQLVVGEDEIEIRGIIRPGLTPCALCAVQEKISEDDGWLDQYPRIRALPDRETLCDPLARTQAGIHAAHVLRMGQLDPDAGSVRRRVCLRTGHTIDEPAAFHPQCRCRCRVPQFEMLDAQAH